MIALDRLPARGTVRLLLAPENAPDLPPRLRVSVDEEDLPEAVVAGAHGGAPGTVGAAADRRLAGRL